MIEKHDTGYFALGVKTTGDHIKVTPTWNDLMAENETLREDLASAKRCWDTAQMDLASYREACGNLMLDASEMRNKIAKLQAIIDKQLY